MLRLPDQHLTRPSAASFIAHGLRVALASVVIALVMVYMRGDVSLAAFGRTLAHATSISLCSWACIDFGRFALPRLPDSGWPRGWWGLGLAVVGCAVGFAVGTALGDVLNGQPVYSSYALGKRSLRADFIGSMMIGALFSGYYYIRGRTAFDAARLLRTERDLSLARLATLQSQLEPHMLFNTLANLRVLIATDPPRAQAMLDRLIAFLRATLDGSRAPLHPLSAEFDRLADYLALMAVRMGPRLQVQWRLPEALRALPVPTMLLQPLVENSIKHGLEPKVEGGRIEVTAAQRGDRLVLCVRDTGVGLAPATRPAPPDTGFGLQQVRDRLATLYGADAEVQLDAAPDADGGVQACITLPMAPPALA